MVMRGKARGMPLQRALIVLLAWLVLLVLLGTLAGPMALVLDLQAAAFVLLLPWPAALIGFAPRELIQALRDGLEWAPESLPEDRRRRSARILRSLGGLAFVAGVFCGFFSFVAAQNAAVVKEAGLSYRDFTRALGTMLLGPAYGLALRAFFYEPLADVLEAGAPETGAGPARASRLSLFILLAAAMGLGAYTVVRGGWTAPASWSEKPAPKRNPEILQQSESPPEEPPDVPEEIMVDEPWQELLGSPEREIAVEAAKHFAGMELSQEVGEALAEVVLKYGARDGALLAAACRVRPKGKPLVTALLAALDGGGWDAPGVSLEGLAEDIEESARPDLVAAAARRLGAADPPARLAVMLAILRNYGSQAEAGAVRRLAEDPRADEAIRRLAGEVAASLK